MLSKVFMPCAVDDVDGVRGVARLSGGSCLPIQFVTLITIAPCKPKPNLNQMSDFMWCNPIRTFLGRLSCP